MNERDRIVVYGANWCPDCKRAKQFLGEQRIPFTWVDLEQDVEAVKHVEGINNGKQIIPAIVFPDSSVLVEPPNAELAQKLGIQISASRRFYDLIVIGGGPAGLTAALYAAREGISTLVIEAKGLGGQAAVTERLDNYPGFPEGVSGDEFGRRLVEQARRFDVGILGATRVSSIVGDGQYRMVRTSGGDEYRASAVLLSGGSVYRCLNVPGEEDFIGAGVHFCATCDGPFYKGQEILVVGGGNSGVQEAIFLTRFATKVTIVEHGDALRASHILRAKAEELDSIDIVTSTEVTELRGDTRLRTVVLRDRVSGASREVRRGAVFVFIGLDPSSEPFADVVETDQYGFIVTDNTLQTNIPGVFAAGDIRAGATKQVASAAGEGATVAMAIRAHLGER